MKISCLLGALGVGLIALCAFAATHSPIAMLAVAIAEGGGWLAVQHHKDRLVTSTVDRQPCREIKRELDLRRLPGDPHRDPDEQRDGDRC